ncbi:fibrobacter succinogenes major paralogous domain-containing protein [Flavobacteriales bacterium]|nr:fibrobacter succinogenes major paralogous domain-containing protein [Flavobacteriales bacterium]
MRYLLTSLLCVLTLSLTAQVDCPNTYDGDEDGAIGISDLLGLLSLFGDADSDSDGVWDSEDDCVDETACNYQSNPTVPCYSLDAIGVCGGHCSADDDDDGVCDAAIFLNCGDDIGHESYNYTTVQIGEQCWFSENCRYLPEVSPPSVISTTSPYYYVYGYEGADVYYAMATDNYETYGALYNWSAVLVEGICPSGWHIPSDTDFTELTDFLGGEDVAGGKMKDDVQWNGSNSSGFTALPSGDRQSNTFANLGSAGCWRSSSEDFDSAKVCWLFSKSPIAQSGSNSKDRGFSARCLQD